MNEEIEQLKKQLSAKQKEIELLNDRLTAVKETNSQWVNNIAFAVKKLKSGIMRYGESIHRSYLIDAIYILQNKPSQIEMENTEMVHEFFKTFDAETVAIYGSPKLLEAIREGIEDLKVKKKKVDKDIFKVDINGFFRNPMPVANFTSTSTFGQRIEPKEKTDGEVMTFPGNQK